MKDQIPTITPNSLDGIHFREIPWQWNFSDLHKIFHINRLEDIRDNLSFPLPPHRKTIYDLIFLTNGCSMRSKGLNQYKICRHQFFFLPAYQVTSHESMSEDATGFYLHFSSELFSDISHILKTYTFLNFSAYPVVSIPDDQVAPILNILHRLEQIRSQLKQEDLGLVKWYLLALLTEVDKHAKLPKKEVKKNSASQLTEQYKDVLTKNIYTKQSVQDYAEILYVTPNHLNKCVKKTVDKTAQALLNEMLIIEAKSLLKYTTFSISEIAEKFGRTPSNFARFFKKQTGITPKQYVEDTL